MLENDAIVISGISGRYPECSNVEEFQKALFAGVDLITVDERRFPPGLLGTPERNGKVKDIDRFDADFFGYSQQEADNIECRQRMMLETVHEAIVDAGLNPKELRGTNTGTYIACSPCDVVSMICDYDTCDKRSLVTVKPAFCASRIAYHYDLKGPSVSLDTACSSGMFAVADAFAAMERGDVDAAIVSACLINLHPLDTLEFYKLNMLGSDGRCKVFNKVRNGYVRSEAVVSFLLQKKSVARRNYGTILALKTNCDGYKANGLTFPSNEMQYDLQQEIYSRYNINPLDVKYVEAHGTGTPVGDVEECQGLVNTFCKDRKEPLLVGAIKSNMGHSETSSSLCSLTKTIITMETGMIPANLHFEEPGDDIPGINDGRLKVVDKNTKFNGGLVASNSFGFGGANAHIVLKPNEKEKSKKLENHRLVHASGTTEEAVKHILDNAEKHKDDPEFLALLDEVHKLNVDGHKFRGYTVIGDNIRQIKNVNSGEKKIWFAYTGIESLTNLSIIKDLLKFEAFKNTINKCNDALKPHNINLIDAINKNENSNEIINSTLTVATQLALTDLLKSLSIVPEGYIGHSVGEIACAYADGLLTIEEAVLVAHARGQALQNASKGKLAVVQISKEKLEKLLSNTLVIAAVNSKDSCIIAGTDNDVVAFQKQLATRGIVSKLIANNYALHSKYVASAGQTYLDLLKKIVKEPKLRSKKWVSTSIAEDKWGSDLAKFSSAEYHTNNFLNPVLFEQGLRHVPQDALIVEISPVAFLQGNILGLVQNDIKDGFVNVLSSIGRLYINGAEINLRGLYNTVKFPVGRGTPMVGSLVKWDHSKKIYIPYFKFKSEFGKKVTVNPNEEQDSYLKSHKIADKVVLPASACLVMVWKVLAEISNQTIDKFPVTFDNVKFKRSTTLTDKVTFLINVLKSGYFEVVENGTALATGFINVPSDVKKEFSGVDENSLKSGSLTITAEEIYKDLQLRGYDLKGVFKGVKEYAIDGTAAKVQWNNNWVGFVDSLLQLALLQEGDQDFYVPNSVLKIVIDPQQHLDAVKNENNVIVTQINKNLKTIKSGGVEIVKPQFVKVPTSKTSTTEETATRNVSNACVSILQPGDLSSLKWVERPSNYHNAVKSKACAIHYATINHKDYLVASGKLQLQPRSDPTGKDLWLGNEFSGVNSRGEKVMGITNGAAINLWLEEEDEHLIWPVPSHWNLEDAATVPLSFATACYALLIRGRLRPGQSVLIHTGAGGVGLAAIAVALTLGCEVFTTVSSKEKKEFLKKFFPQLKEDNIGNSRNTTFESLVMEETKGKGVDVILNTLAGNLFQASLRCLAYHGRFLDIANADLNKKTAIKSSMFLKDCSYHAIMLEDLVDEDKILIKNLVADGIQKGIVKPLPRTVFKDNEVEAAFKHLTNGKHTGKVVIKIRDEKVEKTIKAVAKTFFNSEKTYILNDLGEFGVELANWLTERGVKKLLINASSANLSSSQKACIDKLKEVKVTVEVKSVQKNDAGDVSINAAEKLGPIAGIIQIDQNVDVVKNLDETSRKKCKSLELFLVISSGTSTSGLEKIIQARRSDKLPGLLIPWKDLTETGRTDSNPNSLILNRLDKFIIKNN